MMTIDEYTVKYDKQYKKGYKDGYEAGKTVKHGRWLSHGVYNGRQCYMCSECGCTNHETICHTDYTEEIYYPLGNYCSHCGARMDGDKNGNN